ncbi:MAG TPA: Uma2 family endonuclease, partial [Minicystis sp.]|nr:Uma2 family endonuclease [Minicystis sp.]
MSHDGPTVDVRYARAPRAVHFPTEAVVPESKRHLKLRTLLFQLLTNAFAPRACIGSDQFVYWNAANPRRCVAPDAFVRFGTPDVDFDVWKTWERGAPELAVEITSPSDRPDETWEEKLARYAELGVGELVRFDPDRGELRIWDRVEGDLVERVLDGRPAPSVVTGAYWVVTEFEGGPALRLAEDAEGARLLLTREEAEARARAAEASAREAEA